jgi:acyl-CoA reductase-like NAD-dependent aldehyde dehydrogenase
LQEIKLELDCKSLFEEQEQRIWRGESQNMRSKLFINGKWVESQKKEYMKVFSPVSGEMLGHVPKAEANDVDNAVQAASKAQEKWQYTHYTEKSKLLYNVAKVLEDRLEDLAKNICIEQGKPIVHARIEVQCGIDYFKGAAEDIRRFETAVIPSMDPNKRILTIREPLGIFGVITPWNFPVDIPCFIMAWALAAGNSVVFKPAEQTPLSGAKIVECFDQAGFPPGVVNLVQGPGETTGEAITANTNINAIAFTGSIETGRAIASVAGKTTKTLLLELGGNGPIMILEDADLAKAADGVSKSCFMNSGQVCNSGERIIVAESIYDTFVERIVESASRLKLGNPLKEDTNMGPLIEEKLAQKVDKHIKDAKDLGATIKFGGERAKRFPTSLYYPPTVITQVTPNMLISKEETFGPVCPIMKCASVDEMIKIANSTEYGLMSSVYCSKTRDAFFVAEHVKTGTVAINTPSVYWEGRLPWGGMKGSGIGRQGGKYSLQSMTQVKTIIVDLT